MLTNRRRVGHMQLLMLYRNAILFLVVPFTFSLAIFNTTAEFTNKAVYALAVTDTSGSIGVQLVTVFVFLNSIAFVIATRVPRRVILLSVQPLLAFATLALLSVFWSAYPDLTVRRASRLLIEGVTIVCLALSFRPPENVLKVLFIIFLAIAVVDFATLAIPSISFTPTGFAGFHLLKNEAGEFFFFAIQRWPRLSEQIFRVDKWSLYQG